LTLPSSSCLSHGREHLQLVYDYIRIDSPPALGLLTINALTASNKVYIPLQAEYLATKGLTLPKNQSRLNKDLVVGGVFLTQYFKRKRLHRDVLASMKTYFGTLVFDTLIRDNVALAEALTKGVDIFICQPSSYGSEDYLALCKEIVSRNGH
jgi:chromosome partitioning protein